MLVKQVLNNNVISSLDENGAEIILMGKGLGWHVKAGQPVDMGKVEKCFHMDTPESTEQIKKLMLEVEPEILEISAQIVDYAKEILDCRLNKNLYITLTDHISFAIERFQQGVAFNNSPMAWDIRRFFKSEYRIGLKALDIIENHVNLRLPDEEAASIALHIINSEYERNMGDTMDITNIIHRAIEFVRYTFMIELDEESLNYQRFVTHLQFFAQRIINNKMLDSGQDAIYDMMQKQYPKQFIVAEKIKRYAEKEYNCTITDEEVSFLAVHIVRLTNTKIQITK